MGMSHATCSHPRTPAGRAACRKAGGPHTNPTPTPFVASTAKLTASAGTLRGLGDVRRMARDLMSEHGLNVLWTFEFDNGKRRFGACHHGRYKITLSRTLTELNLDKPDAIRDVILHEIAHALAGHRAGHGPHWRAMARRIGANPTRCYDSNTVTTVDAPYTATCGGCGTVFRRFRRPQRGSACSRCRLVLTFTRTGS